MKRPVLLTMLALLLFLTFSVMAETPPPQSFESPEDALIFFAQKVSEGDLEAALSAMDAKAAAENGDYRALAERIRAILPSSPLMLPGEYAGYVPLNESRIRAKQGDQLYGFVLSLLVPEYSLLDRPMIKDGMIQFPNGVEIMLLDDFIARLNPKNLSTLTLRQIFRLNSARYLSVTTQTYLKKQGAIFGFNEQIDMLAIYELNGQLYRHACTAVERHGGWQLSGLNSPIIGTDAMGSAEPITQEEADALLHSDDYLLFYDIIFND
ncbi:MAG: hypothetical protein ACOX6O_06245 [Christensenellales bacterium]|jgi:hypothetical protein